MKEGGGRWVSRRKKGELSLAAETGHVSTLAIIIIEESRTRVA